MRLTDQHWQAIQPLLPQPSFAHGRSARSPDRATLPTIRGRPPIDERAVLDGIFYKLITARAWYSLPPEYPSWQTCYRRYVQWKSNGLLNQIHRALERDLRERGNLDFMSCLQDGTIRAEVAHQSICLTVPQSLHNTWQLLTILILTALMRPTLKQHHQLTGPLPIYLNFSPVIIPAAEQAGR
jgi:transposase